MKKFKVVTILGTRPEIIRLSRVIDCLDQHTHHVLVHTGQNYDYELNQVFFDELGMRAPDHFLNAAASTPAETIGNIISRVDPFLKTEAPNALLILGDTNSCLAAISAKRRKIPIFHMEAGNRCFDQRVPEEINRKIVDHLSDINLTYSEHARQYLIREGMQPDRIIKTGSPMFEVLNHYLPKIEKSKVLERLKLKERNYFVLSAHREENVDSPNHIRSLVNLVNGVAESYGLRIIFSIHPRTRLRMVESGLEFHPLVELHKPFGFIDFVFLEMNAKVVISDSGTITEESSILNFPAINIREAHERLEGMDEAAVMLVGLNLERVLHAIHILDSQPRGGERLNKIVSDYNVPNVSGKILRLMVSYTDYVQRVVWSNSTSPNSTSPRRNAKV